MPNETPNVTPQLDGAQTGIDVISALIEPLAIALGPGTEVVLHDLRKVPDSIVAISGTVTGRRDGGPGSDLLLKQLRGGCFDDLFDYESVSTDGRPMRSSSVFLRTPEGEAYGCLCINTDVSDLLAARDLLSALVRVGQPMAARTTDPGTESRESFVHDVEELTDTMLDRALSSVTVPIDLMRKSHRVKVIRYLDEQGFFLLKDAVDLAAARLGVSRYSVYNYLNESRPDE